MTKQTIIYTVLMALCIINCTEEILLEPMPVEKLNPYQTFYDAEVFKQRRNTLIDELPENSCAIVATNAIYPRNGDIYYEFKPASNFYYLTGFEEPNAVALLRKTTTSAELVMFVEPRDEHLVKWIGEIYGPEGAVEYFGADSAYSIETFGSYLHSFAHSGAYQTVFTGLANNPAVADTFEHYVGTAFNLIDVDPIIDSLRVLKSEIEIEAIQKAVDVSVQAFYEGMPMIAPGVYEYEIEAQFDYILRLNGCPRAAFPIIVAAGPNLNILHYQENSRKMESGDLVMIDFGAEYSNYASDITRTLPVKGAYTQNQKTIYDIVLTAHEEVLRLAAPGVSYYYLYTLSRDITLDGLLEHGIISGNKSEIIETYRYRQYIPAGLGHCVGLDVHDAFPGEANGDKILKENMVLAIEPHIYLSYGDETVNANYWNISARIEDMIVITANGNRILSDMLPRETPDLENWMNR